MNRIAYLSYLRIFGVLFVVFWHSFCSYGAWNIIKTDASIPHLMILLMNPFGAMMPFMTFISGFLFSHLVSLGKYSDFKNLFKNKLNRLILPMILFGLLSFRFNNDYVEFIRDLFNGIGHLWFLSMLFWCFIVGYLLLKFKQKWIQLVLIFISFCCIYLSFPDYLGIKYFGKLFFYFYAGSLIFNHWKSVVIFVDRRIRIMLLSFLLIALFIVVFDSYYKFIPLTYYGKLIVALLNNNIRLIFILLMMVHFWQKDTLNRLSYGSKIKSFDTNSFGIYIYITLLSFHYSFHRLF